MRCRRCGKPILIDGTSIAPQDHELPSATESQVPQQTAVSAPGKTAAPAAGKPSVASPPQISDQTPGKSAAAARRPPAGPPLSSARAPRGLAAPTAAAPTAAAPTAAAPTAAGPTAAAPAGPPPNAPPPPNPQPPAQPKRPAAPSRPRNEPPLRVPSGRDWSLDSDSFNDETVTLGREEAAALSHHALYAGRDQEGRPQQTGDRITPVSSPASEGFFERGDVDAAMNALDQNVFSAAPPPRRQIPRHAIEDDETKRIIAPSSAFGPDSPKAAQPPSGPSQSAPRSPPLPSPPGKAAEVQDTDDQEATKMYAAPPGATDDTESTMLFAAGQNASVGTETSEDDETRLVESDVRRSGSPHPWPEAAENGNGPRHAVPPAHGDADVEVLEANDGSYVPPLASLGPPPAFAGHPRQSRSAGRSRGAWGLYLFFASISLLVALTGLFFLRRDVFERGVHGIQTRLGLTAQEPVASGPPFDTLAAGQALAEAAARVEKCREADGPTGAGRVRVLFQPSGKATSAAVSTPFHETPVGACLVELFTTPQVPAFGGQPVIVTKSFQLP